jgi:hypothetical protein
MVIIIAYHKDNNHTNSMLINNKINDNINANITNNPYMIKTLES